MLEKGRKLARHVFRAGLVAGAFAVCALFILSLVSDLEWRQTNLANGGAARQTVRRSWRIHVSDGAIVVERIPADPESRLVSLEAIEFGRNEAVSARTDISFWERIQADRRRLGDYDALRPFRETYAGPEYDLLFKAEGEGDDELRKDQRNLETAQKTVKLFESWVADREAATAESNWRWVSERNWHGPKLPTIKLFTNPIATLVGERTAVTSPAAAPSLQSLTAVINGDPAPAPPPPGWLVRAPLVLWTIVAATILLIRLIAILALLRRRHRGECCMCGYDLRASAGACPECGSESLESNTRTQMMFDSVATR